MTHALLIVDVQPTFCEGGALPIEGGDRCAERIGQFARSKEAERLYDLIITTQDWHVDPGEHFSENPDYVDTWPPHALAGSAEAQLHRALGHVQADYSIKKGAYTGAYSGFEGFTPDGTSLREILSEEQVTNVDVVGLALSHCVKATALDAANLRGVKVRVLRDLSEPVSAKQGEEAVAELTQAGVEIIQSADAF